MAFFPLATSRATCQVSSRGSTNGNCVIFDNTFCSRKWGEEAKDRKSMFIFLFYSVTQKEHEKAVKLTMREQRFIKFASVEYDGQLYMTPQDFLDSVVESEPRREYQINSQRL